MLGEFTTDPIVKFIRKVLSKQRRYIHTLLPLGTSVRESPILAHMERSSLPTVSKEPQAHSCDARADAAFLFISGLSSLSTNIHMHAS